MRIPEDVAGGSNNTMPTVRDKRSVLITGTSTGIGRACTALLAQRGYLVFAGVRRTADGETLSRETDGRVEPVILDVTDSTSITEARANIQDRLGGAGLDGLVNNAGIVTPGPLEFTPLPEIEKTIAVNLVGLMAVTQAFIPLVRRAQGRIVNISSLQSRQGIPFMATYSATKAALKGLSEALRLELRPWGIEVVLIEPGSIETPIWEKGLTAWDGKAATSSDEERTLYGDYSCAMRKAIVDVAGRGIPATKVAIAVERALTAARPAPVSLVGADAKVFAALAWLLPARIRDGLFVKMNRLPTRA